MNAIHSNTQQTLNQNRTVNQTDLLFDIIVNVSVILVWNKYRVKHERAGREDTTTFDVEERGEEEIWEK